MSKNESSKIKCWIFLLILYLFVVFVIYACHFHTCELSSQTTDWGAFGSYFGGMVSIVSIILLYLTLREQQRALDEEKRNNQRTRSDTLFMSLLAAFRSDASQMEFIVDCLGRGGRAERHNQTGDLAFRYATWAIKAMQKYIRGDQFNVYCPDEFKSEYENVAIYPPENSLVVSQDLDEIDRKVEAFIKEWQTPYLMFRYEIGKDDYNKLHTVEDEELQAFLLEKMGKCQKPIFNVYLQKASFLLNYIRTLPKDIAEEYQSIFRNYLKTDELSFLTQVGLL